jgi:hypothetical protein
MRVWPGLLITLALMLSSVAPYVPHPYDKLVASVVQLCQFLAELLK